MPGPTLRAVRTHARLRLIKPCRSDISCARFTKEGLALAPRVCLTGAILRCDNDALYSLRRQKKVRCTASRTLTISSTFCLLSLTHHSVLPKVQLIKRVRRGSGRRPTPSPWRFPESLIPPSHHSGREAGAGRPREMQAAHLPGSRSAEQMSGAGEVASDQERKELE